MTADGGLRLECDGPVATVTLDRPTVLNAQTPAMWRALRAFARELPGTVRVVVVRGEGRAFSSGLDRSVLGALTGRGHAAGDAPPASEDSPSGDTIADLVRLSPDQCADRIGEFQEAFTWLHRPDLISIAAVQGYAIGAGFQLALACDLRVVADDAQFAMAEVTLGLVPDLGGTKRLVDLVGYARALEICATGRRIDAAEAERLGLANIVVPRRDLDAATRDLTAALLAGDRDAVIEIKALLSGAARRSYAEQLRAEREAQVRRLRDLAGLGE
ncbi:MAG TPA: enoyl-CoA hydratase/isomerase family protein [Micromonospora sp.]